MRQTRGRKKRLIAKLEPKEEKISELLQELENSSMIVTKLEGKLEQRERRAGEKVEEIASLKKLNVDQELKAKRDQEETTKLKLEVQHLKSEKSHLEKLKVELEKKLIDDAAKLARSFYGCQMLFEIFIFFREIVILSFRLFQIFICFVKVITDMPVFYL